jgi:hypothetical protein
MNNFLYHKIPHQLYTLINFVQWRNCFLDWQFIWEYLSKSSKVYAVPYTENPISRLPQ